MFFMMQDGNDNESACCISMTGLVDACEEPCALSSTTLIVDHTLLRCVKCVA